METLQLKEIERKKIKYARKHFEALGHADIKYDVIDSYRALRDKVMSWDSNTILYIVIYYSKFYDY